MKLTDEEQLDIMRKQMEPFESITEKLAWLNLGFKPDPMFSKHNINIIISEIGQKHSPRVEQPPEPQGNEVVGWQCKYKKYPDDELWFHCRNEAMFNAHMDTGEYYGRKLYTAPQSVEECKDCDGLLEDISKLNRLLNPELYHSSAIDQAKAICEAAGFAVVPKEPTVGLLVSMATCQNHGFGLLDERIQLSALYDMKKLHSEVVGTGYYSIENSRKYHNMLNGAK